MSAGSAAFVKLLDDDHRRIKDPLWIFPIFRYVEILPGIAPSHTVGAKIRHCS